MGCKSSALALSPFPGENWDASGLKFPKKVLIVGPSGAGKTNLLYTWKLGTDNIIEILETGDFNVENVTHQEENYLMFDLSGSPSFRVRRRQFYNGTQGVVLVIDSTDFSKFEEAKQELITILHEQDLMNLPLLILANKQDMADALIADEVGKQIGIEAIHTEKIWNMLPVCAKDDKTCLIALDALNKLISVHHSNED